MTTPSLLLIWIIPIKICLYGILILPHNLILATSTDNSSLERLPDHFIPIHYAINLIPYIEEDTFTFDGESFIEVEAKTESTLIILHACNIKIKGAITLKNVYKTYESNTYTINNKNDFLTIQFHEKILRGNYTLYLKYYGMINDNLEGIYRSSYTDVFGKNQWIVSTHFEPNYARQAFPCWDEPAFKATYKISIKHNRKYTALSNSQFNSIRSTNDSSNHVLTLFEKTPPISSYLIAFIVGDLDYLGHSEDGSFRVWTRKNSANRGEMLLLNGFKALKSLENFTGISYQDHGLKKLDLVVVPQFKSIGMENWGIIFLREDDFISNENHESKHLNNHDIIQLTHELSHQWFGNLVTHKWWENLWLTEGLASYLSYFINDHIESSRAMDKFILDRREDLFKFDSENFVPVLNGNDKLEEIWEYHRFHMNYFKSAVIIRMIKYVLGEVKFKTGIKNYLNNNKFGVVTSNNFFEELTKVSGDMNVTLGQALNNWENTPGYPIITINRNYTSNKAIITQSRFLQNPNQNLTDRYWIPINFANQDNMDFNDTTVTHWVDPDSESLEISTTQSENWLISNKQQFGYYRVNYDEKNWRLIINYLKSENYQEIHYLNRAQLVDDAFTLAQYEYISYSIAFELMEYLKNETDPLPWAIFFNKLHQLHGWTSLPHSQYYETFKKIVSALLENIEKHVFLNETSNKNFFKIVEKKTFIKWTCAYGSSLCKNYTLSLIQKWLKNSEENPLPGDLESEIICGALRYSDENTTARDITMMDYLNSEETNNLNALNCISNVAYLNNILFLTMNKTSPQLELWDFFLAITYERIGLETTLNFINNYQPKIKMSDRRYKFLHNGIIFLRHNVRNDKQFSKWQQILINVIGEKNATNYFVKIRKEVDSYNLKLDSMKSYFEKKVE